MKVKFCDLGQHEVTSLFWARTKSKPSACMSCARKFSKPLKSNPKVKVVENWNNTAPEKPIKRKPISPVSDKQKQRLKEYRIVRDKYMKEHPICEACGSKDNLTLHHKRSRGKYLCDVSTFMTCCFTCHEKIHREDAWARDNGYLLSKLF